MNQNYNFVQGLFSQVMNGKNQDLATKRSTSFTSFLLLMVFAFFANFSVQGQTVLLSPTGDGGFETGTTLTANGWTGVSSVQTFFVGSATPSSLGSNCAFSSTSCTNFNVCHIYKDVTIPAGETILTISYKFKISNVDASFDYLQTWLVPTTTTPVSGTLFAAGGGNVQIGANNNGSTSYVTYTNSISVVPGTTQRIVISFRQDGFAPYGASAVDEISLISSAPATFTATANGGLWSSPATWVGGVVPGAGNDIVIPTGAIVTVDQVTSYRNLDVNGILQWNATANAMTLGGNLNINSGARFLPYSSVATPVGVVVNIGGNFQNNGYANLALSTINFNGTGSTLSGTGVFEGDGTRGIIRTLAFQNLGSNTVSTSQNLTVTSSLAVTAGSLNTNGKLRIDNTAQIYGQALNLQVASAAVTNMGSLYTVAPVVFGTAVVPYANALAAVANTRYFYGNNVYLCTTAGTFNATPPTSTAAATFTSSGPTLIWAGELGTLGTPLPFGTGFTLSLTTQYFVGNNVYQAILNTASTADFPTHTSGVARNLRWIGTVAKASVNFDSVTGTVRSLNLTQPGSGFSTAPAVAISKGLGDTTGTSAAATAVLFQQIAGIANSSSQKSGAASITGG